MVLTAVQTTAFFEENAQMGIPHDSVIQLWNEGISTVNNLADFDKIHSLSWWKTSENQGVYLQQLMVGSFVGAQLG